MNVVAPTLQPPFFCEQSKKRSTGTAPTMASLEPTSMASLERGVRRPAPPEIVVEELPAPPEVVVEELPSPVMARAWAIAEGDPRGDQHGAAEPDGPSGGGNSFATPAVDRTIPQTRGMLADVVPTRYVVGCGGDEAKAAAR